MQPFIYGRVFQVCPPTSGYPRVFTDADIKEAGCTYPGALKTIEEKCHGQEACSMVTAPEVFGAASFDLGDEEEGSLPEGLAPEGFGDPCPGVRKYVEVAYKCKPTQFR